MGHTEQSYRFLYMYIAYFIYTHKYCDNNDIFSFQ